jgi:hypothetical protein
MILTNTGLVLAGVLLALVCGILFICSLVEWLGGKRQPGKETDSQERSVGSAGERESWLSVRGSSEFSSRAMALSTTPRGE